MGVLRNDIWAVWRIINLRTYKAKFSYLPEENVKRERMDSVISTKQIEENFPQWNDEVPSNWITIEDTFIVFWASQVTHAGTSIFNSPKSTLDDGVFEIFVIR